MSLLPYLLPALQLDVLLNSIYLSSFFSKSFSGANMCRVQDFSVNSQYHFTAEGHCSAVERYLLNAVMNDYCKVMC